MPTNGETATTAAHQADPVLVFAVIGFIGLGFGLMVALAARAAWHERRALRRCPVCGADAVRGAVAESIGAIDTQIDVQCGHCATWRRVVASAADEHGHRKRLQRDQRRIGSRVRRLESARRSVDCRAFIAALRSDIAGADDFLAFTRPPRALATPPRHRRRGDR